jgi:Co/Zn/Cd efflux system component
MTEINSASSSLFHSHVFLGEGHQKSERKTWAVIWLCGIMMIAEIVGGFLFGSIALIADGLHMSTHAGALLIGYESVSRIFAPVSIHFVKAIPIACLGLAVNIASAWLLSGEGQSSRPYA